MAAAAAAPPAAASANTPALDLDLQAVEGIPKDTLVALLKRKNKEAKAVQTKLDKLEERYVKVVRFNKILMEDRTSFQRFCNSLLPESDGVFEEAAAQESPVNLDALMRRLTVWRSALDAATEDRRVFRQFIDLVFPGDESVHQVLEQPVLGSDAFDALQQRWLVLEDLHNQSIASINAMAREQLMEKAGDLETALAAKQEAERRVEEMREQVTQVAREKAQMLKQRMGVQADGAGPGGAAAEPDAPEGAASEASRRLLAELREARDAAERREREARELAERQERELRAEADAHRAEALRLRRELEDAREEGERQRAHAQQRVEQKDEAVDKLQQRLAVLEEELSSNAFITHCAEQQAGRDAEVKAKQRQLEQLNQQLLEIQNLLNLSYSQEKVLKARIRELEQSHGRSHTAGDYLKHVALKYIQYTQVGDLKAQSLVPVLCKLLNFSPEEVRTVENPAMPQSLLLLNQAVGGAASWLKGEPPAAASGASGGAPPPDPLGDG